MSLASFCANLSVGSLYALITLTPLIVLPFTLGPLEINKQTALVTLVLISGLSWLLGCLAQKAASIRLGWVNILPLALLGAVICSAASSSTILRSWLGASGLEYTSFLSIFALVLLFYLAANLLTAPARLRVATGLWLTSASATGLVGLLALFNLAHLPFSFAQHQAFNLIGTPNAFAIFLAVSTILGQAYWVMMDQSGAHAPSKKQRPVYQALILLVTIEMLLVLAALDYWVLWTVLLAGVGALLLFTLRRADAFQNVSRLILPMGTFVIGGLLFFAPPVLPVTPPVEVTPSYEASMEIANQTLTASSRWFGSGPGTFLFDYTKFHDIDVNSTTFWNLRFDRAASEFLTMYATTGLLTTGLLLLLFIVVALKAGNALLRSRDDWMNPFLLAPAWVALITAFFLYPFNITLSVFLFLSTGLIAGLGMKRSAVQKFPAHPRLGLIAAFLFAVLATGMATVLFVTFQRYAGEIAFAKAVRGDREGRPVSEVVALLDQAATLNRYDDIYYRNLSQALLLQLNDELNALSTGSSTEEQRDRLQALTAASINAAVRATELSPDNVLNWLQRGAVYREFSSSVDGAGAFAVSAYLTATELEPLNPANHTELGKTYLKLSEDERVFTAAEDVAVRDAHTEIMNQYLALAEASFSQAVTLKPDYAPAHYQLAITFERQGRLNDAIGKMESVVKYNQLDVGATFQLGVLYLRRGEPGDLERAQGEFEIAVGLVPGFSNAHWFLAYIYERQGNLDAAIREIEKVLELNPDNAIVSARLERLKNGEIAASLPTVIDEPIPETPPVTP